MSDIELQGPVDGVLTVTLNRPQRLNAFTFEMVAELEAALKGADADPECRVVVLTGAGRGFCSGHDRGDQTTSPWNAADHNEVRAQARDADRYFALTSLMRTMRPVVIAAVNGPAAGAGLSIALAADLTVAGHSASFVNGFVNTGGVHMELGISQLLPRIVGSQRAARMLIAAETVSADVAAEWGLVGETVADDELPARVAQLAAEVSARPEGSLELTKQLFWAGVSSASIAESARNEARSQLLAQSIRRAE
ncbi:enoyl-CoA hydratase/isomerase family protein [Aeromicrobium sp. UC242_57]|uniref:enoyl-CoA hydratase/isomerase family protein n=1 Tax=Aeromicrobium sp. UC242_57 TaxID=3374624 RepID=UPI0037AD50B8